MKRDHNYVLHKFILPPSISSSLYEVPAFWQGSESLKLKNGNHYWCLKTIYPHAMVFIFDFDDIYLGSIAWNIFDKYFFPQMKNIHILPTDKPSRLHSWTDEKGTRLELCDLEYSHTRNTQHIYITNDEETLIKDWCFAVSSKQIFQNVNLKLKSNDKKKIILTTDPDLIKDGVQAIDDEFLEWFVRNPNCDEVKINTIPRCCGRCDGIDDLCYSDMTCTKHKKLGCEDCYGKRVIYKVIIPKEFGNSFENLANVISIANFMFDGKKEINKK